MSRLPVEQLPAASRELDLGPAKTYHLPDWHNLSHPERLAVIRRIAEMRGRDPRIARLATSILKKARVLPREFDKQAAALLRWVQTNVYYVNEPGERLQDPIYTLSAKHGDCDDMVLLLCSLYESIRLSWRLVLSGKDDQGNKVRYIEGNEVPPNVHWAHIFCIVGVPPFEAKKWYYAEPTVQGVPLGWDVISGPKSYLPKYLPKYSGPPRIVHLAGAPRWKNRSRVPPPERRSPAYAMAMGGDLGQSALVGSGALVGGVIAAEQAESSEESGWKKNATAILIGVVTGVSISVLAAILTPWVKKKLGIKEEK